MQLPNKTRDVIGCLNLTHYSLCRYCAHSRECVEYRTQYHRTNIMSTGDKFRYKRITSYDMTGKVMAIVGIEYTKEEIKAQVEYLNDKVNKGGS